METTVVRNEVKRHDFFNIVVLLFICSLNIYFLSLTTDISLLGTDELASEPYHRFLFKLSLYLFIAYVVFDTFWVVLIPSCVLSNPTSILFHHLVTLVMTLVPFVHQQFGWHFGACILVEVNTFFLTLRRNLSRGTAAYAISDILFYVSWVVLRLVLFPWLTLFYIREYIRFSTHAQTYFNLVLITPCLQTIVTMMSFMWTVDMLKKQFGKSKQPRQQQKEK
eukprot:gene29853-39017_t